MADTNIGRTTTTNLTGTVQDFSVTPMQTTGAQGDETIINYDKFTKYYGYYRTIPELKKAIDTLGLWVTGKGYEADARAKVLLGGIVGNGKENFDMVIWNAFVTGCFNGDSFCEIITDSETSEFRNLKVLDPNTFQTILDGRGMIKEYRQIGKGNNLSFPKKFKPSQIFHYIHDKVCDEGRGTSIVEACQWVIDARNEAMSDKRRVHHRSTIRIIEVDTDDSSKLSSIKTQYGEAIKNGEVLIVPKGNFSFPDAPINYIDTLEWIRYLESFFYVAAGVPKSLINPEGLTEAASQTGFLSFDPVFARHQINLEKQLFNQLGIRLTFNKPPSLMDKMQSDEEKNTGQIGVQPADFSGGLTDASA